MGQKKEKMPSENLVYVTKEVANCTVEQIQGLLPQGLTVKSKKPVIKDVHLKVHKEMEIYATIWCRNENKESILVLYDGDKLKKLSEQELMDDYVVHTIKNYVIK